MQAEQHVMTRMPWGADGLPVIAQSLWAPNLQKLGGQFNLTSGQCLHWHPEYEEAKKGGNAEAAMKVIDTVVNDKRLLDLQQKIAGKDVIFLAPYVHKTDGGRNMLPITFAHFLAKHFGAEVAEDVRQVARVGRKEMDSIDKLLHQPTFAGTIKTGRQYVLVDDSTKEGGTAATLRSFVEHAGGKVICVATLANCAGSMKNMTSPHPGAGELGKLLKQNIAITAKQIEVLEKKVGPHVGNILERYCHFGSETLTSREAQVIGEYGHELKRALVSRSAGGHTQGPSGGPSSGRPTFQ